VLGLDVVETWRWDDLTSCKQEAATAIGFAKRKTLSRPCRLIPRACEGPGQVGRGTTKTQKSLLSRDQIAGEGGHAAGGAQSAMAPPWFCDELGAGDRCRGNLLFYPNVLLCPELITIVTVFSMDFKGYANFQLTTPVHKKRVLIRRIEWQWPHIVKH
jgi:hypothetical protein